MKTMKEHWADILDTLKNAWPQLSGVAIAIFIRYACLIYDGDTAPFLKTRRPVLCLCLALFLTACSAPRTVYVPVPCTPLPDSLTKPVPPSLPPAL